MTVGSTFNDRTVLKPYYVDGAFNGNVKVGVYRSKTWSGVDGLPSGSRPKGLLRKYTTIDQKGRRVTRSFRDRPPKRASWKEPHPYTVSSYAYESTLDRKPDIVLVTQSWTQTISDWCFPADNPGLPPLPIWTANDDIKLVGKLKEKVRGSDFNMSVFLGEGHQTLTMIGDSAIRIARAINLLTKGNVIGAVHEMSKSAQQTTKLKSHLGPRGLWTTKLRRNATNQLSNNWLELQYGWLPLLNDIRSGAEQLAHRLNVPFRQRYAARHSLKTVEMPLTSVYGFADGGALYRKQIVAFISEPESIPKLLGLLNPELVLWERTPFSFVADWIIPFGDYLDARAFTSGLTGLFVTTESQLQVWKGITGKTFDTGLIHGYSTASISGYFASKMTMSRSVATTLSVPMPAVKPLSKVASWQHCANGIALLAQVSRTRLSSPPSGK